MFEKNSKVVEFIVKKIKETQKTSLEISDEMSRLKLAASEVSYAHVKITRLSFFPNICRIIYMYLILSYTWQKHTLGLSVMKKQ